MAISSSILTSGTPSFSYTGWQRPAKSPTEEQMLSIASHPASAARAYMAFRRFNASCEGLPFFTASAMMEGSDRVTKVSLSPSKTFVSSASTRLTRLKGMPV